MASKKNGWSVEGLIASALEAGARSGVINDAPILKKAVSQATLHIDVNVYAVLARVRDDLAKAFTKMTPEQIEAAGEHVLALVKPFMPALVGISPDVIGLMVDKASEEAKSAVRAQRTKRS